MEKSYLADNTILDLLLSSKPVIIPVCKKYNRYRIFFKFLIDLLAEINGDRRTFHYFSLWVSHLCSTA